MKKKPDILTATVKERMNLIRKRLRAARSTHALSQRQAADAVGIHRPTLSLIERGGQTLTVEQLLRLASVYNYSPGYLLAVDCDTVDMMTPRELGNLKVMGSVPWPDGKPDLG